MAERKIPITVFVDLADLGTGCSNLDEDTILEMIKYLDKSQDDWEFTKRAYGYFRSEMVKLLEEDDGLDQNEIENWFSNEPDC